MAYSSASFKLIPDDWKLKKALVGVYGCSHIFFEVFTHIKQGEMKSEIMVMMTKDDYDLLIQKAQIFKGE